MSSQPVPDWGNLAAQTLSASTNFRIRPIYHTMTEVAGACPFCKQGTDRFLMFAEGNYWCRKCHKKGWWRTTSAEELAEQKKTALASQQETRRRLQSCNDWKTYHRNVHEHMSDWLSHGLEESDVLRYQLGYTTNRWNLPSLTIPIFFQGLLVDIRHRLLGTDTDKYRSHFANTPPGFLNGDAVTTSQKIFLVEGEKKAIILEKYGIAPTVSYPGINTQDALIAFLHDQGTEGQDIVYIPDPNTYETILYASRELKKHGRHVSIVELFLKPDDLLLRYGATPLVNAIARKQRV